MLTETDTRNTKVRSRLSWASIFGGTVTALGLWILLGTFGLATGFSAMEPGDESLKGEWIWMGIWSLVIPIVAAFIGGYVATRSAGSMLRRMGMLHGLVVWGFTMLIGTLLILWSVGAIAGRTVTVTSELAGATATTARTAGQHDGGGLAQAIGDYLDIDRFDLVRAVNQHLLERQEQPITETQFRAAIRQAANDALREGQMTEEILVDAFSRHTPLEEQEIRALSQDLMDEWNQTVGSAKDAALSAANMFGNGMWWVFFSMLIALGASLAGGILGARRERPVVVAPETPVEPHEPVPTGHVGR